MQGLKGGILAIFQTGKGWPRSVSTAFKNPLLDFIFFFFALGSFEFLAMLEGKTRKGLFF